MLLDPPGMGGVQTVAPVAVAPAPAPVAAPAAVPQAQATPAPVAALKPAPAPQAAAPERVKGKRGDTLTGIASRVRPEGASLEQTLLGLYRENDQAFDGNMNRLKAGKTLKVPSAEKVAGLPQAEAVRELRLQAEDWRGHRHQLGGGGRRRPAAREA